MPLRPTGVESVERKLADRIGGEALQEAGVERAVRGPVSRGVRHQSVWERLVAMHGPPLCLSLVTDRTCGGAQILPADGREDQADEKGERDRRSKTEALQRQIRQRISPEREAWLQGRRSRTSRHGGASDMHLLHIDQRVPDLPACFAIEMHPERLERLKDMIVLLQEVGKQDDGEGDVEVEHRLDPIGEVTAQHVRVRFVFEYQIAGMPFSGGDGVFGSPVRHEDFEIASDRLPGPQDRRMER
jgi:hypothetical protein